MQREARELCWIASCCDCAKPKHGFARVETLSSAEPLLPFASDRVKKEKWWVNSLWSFEALEMDFSDYIGSNNHSIVLYSREWDSLDYILYIKSLVQSHVTTLNIIGYINVCFALDYIDTELFFFFFDSREQWQVGNIYNWF